MRYLLPAIIMTLGLSGCGLFNWSGVDSITVVKRPADRTPLNLPDPPAIKPSVPEWIVVTPGNIDRVWADLKAKNMDVVLFALTDDGYEELAVDMAQIRNHIAHQREIIVKYRDYYEPRRPEERPGEVKK